MSKFIQIPLFLLQVPFPPKISYYQMVRRWKNFIRIYWFAQWQNLAIIFCQNNKFWPTHVSSTFSQPKIWYVNKLVVKICILFIWQKYFSKIRTNEYQTKFRSCNMVDWDIVIFVSYFCYFLFLEDCHFVSRCADWVSGISVQFEKLEPILNFDTKNF